MLNLVPKVSYLPALSLASGGGKVRDPGNEVAYANLSQYLVKRQQNVFTSHSGFL